MLDQKLIEAIREHIQKGTNPAAIKDVLLEKGYTQQDVDESLRLILTELSANTPVPKEQNLKYINEKKRDIFLIIGLFFLLLIILGVDYVLYKNSHIAHVLK